MTTQTKKFIITSEKVRVKKPSKLTFFQRAQKHIAKGRKGVSKNLSRDIDKIVYGAR